MKLKHRDPNHPEVVESVLQHIKSLSPEETLNMLAWRPDEVEETWMLEDAMANRNGKQAYRVKKSARTA